MVMERAEVKSAVEAKLNNELNYILSSMTFEGRHSDELKGKLANSITKSLSKNRRLPENAVDINASMLAKTIHFRLAQVLKQARTWADYRELVQTFIPEYKKSPKLALETGGLPWKTQFDVPKPNRRCTNKKIEKGERPEQQVLDYRKAVSVSDPGVSTLKELTYKISELEQRSMLQTDLIMKLVRIAKAHGLNVLPPTVETIEF